jgi:hypothetical protein
MLVARKAHKASAITFRETKEGAVEAHSFFLQASITTMNTHNEKKWDASLVASAKTLAKSVFSIGTSNSTSKVAEEDPEESKEEEEDSNKDKLQKERKRVAIKVMQMLEKKKSTAMPFATGESEDENKMEEGDS